MTTVSANLSRPNAGVSSVGVAVDARQLAAVATITLVGLIIRAVGIDRHSFWYDEAVTADLIRAPWLDLLLGRVRDNGNPPVYWLCAKAWATFFGDGEVALRSLSVMFSVASIPFLAALAQRLFDRSTALFAAGLLAISPISLELANETRAYALLHLLVIASTLLLVRWMDRRGGAVLLLYCITIFAACLSHYYAVFVPLAHGVTLLVTRDGRRRLGAWLAAMAATALVGGFWFPAFWQQMHTPDNLSRMGSRWLMQFFATPLVLAAGRTLVWRDASVVVLAAATAGALAFFGTPALVGVFRVRRNRRVATLLLSMALLPILAPLLAALLGTRMYHARAASIVLPVLLLLIAAGLAVLSTRARLVACVGILAMTVLSIGNYLKQPLKDDWRAVAPALITRIASADHAVLFDTSIEVTPFAYYARQTDTPTRAFVVGVTELPDGANPSLTGVRFDNLRQAERASVNYVDKVLEHDFVTVALCVPIGNTDLYTALFTARGYELAGTEHHHRIDLLYFTRPPTHAVPNHP